MNAFEEYLSETAGSGHTVQAYARDADEFAAFLAGRPVSVHLLREWVRSLDRLPHGRNRPQTVSRKLSGVRRWLGWRRVELDDADAAAVLDCLRDFKVSPAVRQRDREEVRPVEPADFERVLPHLRREARSLAEFLWQSGARISEALGDSLADIPPLTIEDGRRLARDGWVRQDAKGGRRRILILAPAGRKALENGGCLASGAFDETRPGATGGPLWTISRSAFNRNLHLAADAAGVPRFGAHGLRHGFKARLRRSGVEGETIRRLLGHSPANVTEGYGREGVEELLAAVGRLA